jgi:hypothetical protein
MRRLSFLLAVLSALFLTQCQKEVSHIGGPDPVIVTPDPITANLQGIIFDESGQPAPGVAIKVGSQAATTNAKGYFRINNASLDKKAALVVAEKAGYFKALRTFSATSGTNQVVIKLIKKQLAGTIDGTTGGEVSFASGAKVALKPNGVVNAATGAAYTGAVSVYAAYIDPTAADIDQVIPGSFMANDKNGGRVSLASYGMMAVELESSTGEKLQVKSGSTATLTTPIPASAQASAPATIPMWYVDEATGLWKEQGTATKQGTVYVGDVSHFSFWNCDVSINSIQLSLTVKNGAGDPIVHAWVRIKRNTQYQSYAYGWTDTLGQVSGLVPANESLILDVLDQCGNSVYTQNIGPFAQATNLGVITIPSSNPNLLTVKGKLLDCNGQAVTNGYAIVTLGWWYSYAATDANGDFEVGLINCNTTSTGNYTVIGVDGATQQQSASVTGVVTMPLTNVGNITACGTSSAQYFTFVLDGTTHTIAPPPDSLTANTYPLQGTTQYTTYINASSNAPSNFQSVYFNFTSSGTVPGTYPVGGNSTTGMFSVSPYNQGNTLVQPFNVVITNFPTVIGQFYEGNMNGQFRDAQNVLHNFSANFRIRKNF